MDKSNSRQAKLSLQFAFSQQAADPFTPMQIREAPPTPLNKAWPRSVKITTKSASVWYLWWFSPTDNRTFKCHRRDMFSPFARRKCLYLGYSDFRTISDCSVAWICGMMGALVNGRRGGRSPSLLMAALIACVLLLGFNYWVSNSRNVELQVCVYVYIIY